MQILLVSMWIMVHPYVMLKHFQCDKNIDSIRKLNSSFQAFDVRQIFMFYIYGEIARSSRSSLRVAIIWKCLMKTPRVARVCANTPFFT